MDDENKNHSIMLQNKIFSGTNLIKKGLTNVPAPSNQKPKFMKTLNAR
jgi:hypothetical protein